MNTIMLKWSDRADMSLDAMDLPIISWLRHPCFSWGQIVMRHTHIISEKCQASEMLRVKTLEIKADFSAYPPEEEEE